MREQFVVERTANKAFEDLGLFWLVLDRFNPGFWKTISWCQTEAQANEIASTLNNAGRD